MQVVDPLLAGAVLPLDDIPAPGRIQSGYWRGLKCLVRRRGGDPRAILEHEDIDPQAFEEPETHIDCAAAVDLLEYCSQVLRDPLFGVHLADQQAPEVFGCVATLARAAPSLRAALQGLIDYVPVCTSPECELEMVMTREVVELRWRTTQAGLSESTQAHFHGLRLVMKTLHMLGHERFRASYATLTLPVERSALQALQERLGCKLSGKAAANAIAFPVELLDCPLPTSNRMLFGILNAGLSQVRALSRGDVVEQVEAYVRGALAMRHCSVRDCAKQLGTSARTLQKRLACLGLTFVDIVHRERIKLAKHALLWSQATLDEIAFRLGYAEQTNFGRAFKRATGMTPQQFRMSRGGGKAVLSAA